MQRKLYNQQGERGIALLAVLFALLLLSVIGLGMMYSTNLETKINANYRDKQIALHAAISGLQEARDRIQPATGNITGPTELPSLTASNVVYIVNPKGGETITPWLSSTKYSDPELCQESVLGLTGTPGVPCTGPLPSDLTWRRFVDNSLSSSAPWNLSTPLDVKWTRISLKGNNMTPVPVNGDPSNSDVVCWDGVHQLVRPAGYGNNCLPDGSIASMTVTNGGTGYTSIPTVTIGAPPAGGIQATATANIVQISNGQVASVAVTSAGSGYTSAPTVTFSGGGGSGAAATAVIVPPGAPVSAVNLTSAGQRCFAPGTATVSFSPNLGASAHGVLASTPSCIVSWTVSGSCSSKHNEDVTVGLSGGSFQGTIHFDSHHVATSATITQPGSGYTANFTGGLTGTPINPCNAVTSTATVGYLLNSLALDTGGAGYTSTPAVTINGGVPTSIAAPTGTATLGPAPANVGQITAINVTSNGSGYATPPIVTLSGGGGSGGAAIATLGITYKVQDFTITNHGKGYTTDPPVTISGGGGSGATGTAQVGRGTNFGQVYLITSLAQTATGARAMAQMELSTPPLGIGDPQAALVLDGPLTNASDFVLNLPNSNNFGIHGEDNNSCSGTPTPVHPAVGGYDDPSSDDPLHSVNTIIDAIPDNRLTNYTGTGGIPSVVNVYGSLGETLGTVAGLNSVINQIHDQANNVYGNNPGSVDLGTADHPVVNFVDGDLTLSGNNTGYGILVITGTLHLSGNFGYHGVVYVIGDGVAEMNGGGNREIWGTMLIAKIWDTGIAHTEANLRSTLGAPSLDWNGGGTNEIRYDHCWADDMLRRIRYTPIPSTLPLKILNTRTLSY
jgi:hypothetical protein